MKVCAGSESSDLEGGEGKELRARPRSCCKQGGGTGRGDRDRDKECGDGFPPASSQAWF